MGAEALVPADQREELRRELDRLERAEAQALESRHREHLAAGICQRDVAWQVAAVGAEVDARQHDFLESHGDELLRLAAHVLRQARLDGAARVRDDAVRAEILAAVFDLEEGARALRAVVERDVLEGLRLHDVRNRALDAVFLHGLLDVIDDVSALLRAEHDAHALDGADLVRRDLRVAAADGHDGLRVLAMRAADDLAALAVAEARDGASIDDVDIGARLERHDLIAALLEETLHGLRLKLVDLTAKCGQSNFQLPKSPFSY